MNKTNKRNRSDKMIHQWNSRIWGFFLCIVVIVLSACEGEEIPIPGPPSPIPTQEETVYLSLNVGLGSKIKTKSYTGENEGTPEERYVQKVRMVLYDGDQPESIVIKAFDFKIQTDETNSGSWIDNNDGIDLAPTTNQNDDSHFITYARKVPEMAYKMLVLINPTEDLLQITQEVEEGVTPKKTLGEFLAAQKIEGDEKSINIGGLAESKYFLMTNSNGLVDVPQDKLWDTKNKAHSNPIDVFVDRVVSKVTVLPENLSQIPLKDNAQVSDLTWALDVTNKWTYWMRVTTEDKGNYREDWYAVDPNFTGQNTVTDADREKQFYYYSNQYGDMPSDVFPYTLGNSEYCLENTMAKNEQHKANIITRVIIRCIYKPGNVDNLGDSFYAYDNQTYSLQDMNEFSEIAENYPEIILDELGKTIRNAKVKGYEFKGKPTFNGQEIKESFRYQGITYYYGGVNYYAMKILHFGHIDSTAPGPGYYGVIRNTNYKVNILGIDGPGNPTIHIPMPAQRSIILGSDDDDLYSNISAKIEVQR